MTQEEKDFYGSFKVVNDTLSVRLQLNRLTDKMHKALKDRYGKIIPVQTKSQLRDVFEQVLDDM